MAITDQNTFNTLMSKIKDLFDPSKDIYRSIEKVVTFGSLKPESLKREISEYVVTERLRNNFEKILDAMNSGMQTDSHEIGIWVSGFYGSGKSSFAKYFGLGLKKNYIIEGSTFQDRLINRINSLPISQQLRTIVQKYDPEIFLIDLATQQISGYTLAPVGTIIYHEVMKWAGYATEEKIALLERKLELDGKFEEFKTLVKKEKDEDWDKLKFEDKLTAKGIAQELAPRFYPNIWRDAKSFNITRVEDIENDKEKVTQMLALIKKKSGKENVLFIIDEVGQYVSADNSLILQLQGTMENLKDIGNGKAWLLATAQQTLTEDNPNARFNSDKLYKLNDRFPIKIDIEASDIKEITTQRLLGKSQKGADELKKMYSKNGEMLRLNARLTNVERTLYKTDLDEKSFIDLYPFLPHHFNLLLALLARLAKKTGGIGLRSAIRVIQDVLTENTGDMLAEGKIGTLATTAHIYNVLKSDIRKSYPHVAASVEKIINIFKDKSEEANIAKSIATLQILDDFYLSVDNLAVMIHPSVDASSQIDKLKAKVNELKNTKGLTLKEIDGQLRFMTDAIIRIEEEKLKIFVSGSSTRKVYESQIEDIFSPAPTTRIANTKSVKSGVQFVFDERLSKITTENDEIQTEIHFAQRSKYTQSLDELKHRSTEKLNESKIYLLGLFDEELDKTLEEIVRCEEIASQKHKYDDKEIIDYLNSQFQEAQVLRQQIKRKLLTALESGEFIFRGTSKPAKAIGETLREATNLWLKHCAEKIYHKYDLASQTIDSVSSQRLLQFDDLRSVSGVLNPFNIIKSDGSVDVNAASLKSIQDYLQNEGQVEGRKLLEHFSESPFGWHKDTTRYLVTIMFLASIIKLRIAGDTVKVKGPSAIEKLSNSSAFNQIGVSLHSDDQPTNEQKLCAAKNLTELTLNTVPPLPQKISEVVMKYFPEFQRKYAELRPRLEALRLPGVEKAELIQEGIAEIIKGDASDATFRLGKEDSDLYLALLWAKKIHHAISNGIEKVIKKIQETHAEVNALPHEGLTGELKTQLEIKFDQINRTLQSESFFEKAADLNDSSTEIDSLIADVCEKFRDQENETISSAITQLKSSYNWQKVKPEQKQEFLARLERSIISDKSGIKGIREIINEVYSFNILLKNVEKEIEELAKPDTTVTGPMKVKKVTLTHLPKRIEKKTDVDNIVNEFIKIKDQLNDDEVVDINW
jgi:hypothetical protein